MQSPAIARLFASSIVKEMARWGRSPLFAAVVRETKVAEIGFSGETVADLFEHAFAWLKRGHLRDEYVYKSALTEKVLMGRHSLDTASMLTEFRIGASKADVVILNGTGTVYEIKSERDSLTRLTGQLDAFKTVFPVVNVIVGENHLASVMESVSSDTGVMVLSHRHQISTVREATHSMGRTSPSAMFSSLTMREAEMVLNDVGVEVPAIPNTLRYDMLHERFRALESTIVHAAMVRVLKRTRSQATLRELVGNLPSSLHSLVLTTRIRKQDHSRLIEAVATPLSRAMLWGTSSGLPSILPRKAV